MVLETITPETVWEKGYDVKKPQGYMAGRRETTVPVILIVRNPYADAVRCSTEQSCKVTIDYKEIEARVQPEDIETVYNEIDTSTKIPLAGVELLENKYIIDNASEITSALRNYLNLIETLSEAHKQIQRIFAKNIVEVCLLLNKDFEENFTGVAVVIKTTLKSSESLTLLDKFDEEYWLDLSAEIRNIVTVIVRNV